MQFLAGFESDRLARGDRYLGACPRIASDSRFTGTHVKDAKTAQFDAISRREGFLQTLKDRIDCRLRLIAWQARTFDDVMNNVLFYQRVHLFCKALPAGFTATGILESFSCIVNAPGVT